MSDDTPTERLPEPVPEAGAESAVAAKPASGGMSRGLLITLIVIGSLLLVAIVALLIALLAGGGDDNSTAGPTPTESSASPTPSPSETEESESPSATPEPSPSKTEDPAPPSNGPKIDSFKVSTKDVYCPAPDAPGATPPPDLHFTWKTSHSENVVFGINAPGDDATNGSFAENLPTQGSLDRPVSCSSTLETTRYTLTVVGDGGAKVSQTIKVNVHP